MRQNRALISLFCTISLLVAAVLGLPTAVKGPEVPPDRRLEGSDGKYHNVDSLLHRRNFEGPDDHGRRRRRPPPPPLEPHLKMIFDHGMKYHREQKRRAAYRARWEGVRAKEGNLWNSHWDAAKEQMQLASGTAKGLRSGASLPAGERWKGAMKGIGLGAKALATTAGTLMIKMRNRTMQSAGAIPYHVRGSAHRWEIRKDIIHHGFKLRRSGKKISVASDKGKLLEHFAYHLGRRH